MEKDELLYDLQPVDCLSCGAQVGVRKHSPVHTSVQWTGKSVRKCQEFQGVDSARIKSCDRLRMSIEAAVNEGLVEVRNG